MGAGTKQDEGKKGQLSSFQHSVILENKVRVPFMETRRKNPPPVLSTERNMLDVTGRDSLPVRIQPKKQIHLH